MCVKMDSLPKTVELKLREYEKDEDRDGVPYYRELMEGTSDSDGD